MNWYSLSRACVTQLTTAVEVRMLPLKRNDLSKAKHDPGHEQYRVGDDENIFMKH